MDLLQILETKESYDAIHKQVVDTLLSIIDRGEMTEDDIRDLESTLEQDNEHFNKIDQSNKAYNEQATQEQIEYLKNNKLNLDLDSVIDLLTQGGRNNIIYKTGDGRLIIDGDKIDQIKQVKFAVDEQAGQISSLIADSQVEVVDGEGNTQQVKLKVLYSTMRQTMDGFVTKVGEIEGIANGANNTAAAAQKTASEAKQTADKFNWLVTSNSTASSLTITDKLIEAIAGSSIKLKADQIALEGYTTINKGFKVDENGNITATNANITGKINATSGEISSEMKVNELNVEGNLSVDTLTVRQINCSDMLRTIDQDLNLKVDSNNGNDEADLIDGAIFETLQGCLESLPKNLNGYTVNIQLLTDIEENIKIRGFVAGAIYIKMNLKNIRGNIRGYDCGSRIFIYGGNNTSDISTGANSTRPCIKPNTLITADTYDYGVYFSNCNYIRLRNIDIYGQNTSSSQFAIGAAYGTKMTVQNCKVVGSYNGIQVRDGASCLEYNTYGKVTAKGHRVIWGGTIFINDGTIINGTIEKSNSSQVIYNPDSVTFDGTTADIGTNDNTGTVATSTVSLKSTGGNTYRHNVYTGWKNDNTVRQGDYGYGDCDGCWFFGTQFANQLAGKTIKKVTLKITRNSGGISSSVTHILRMHTHTSKPSGAPSFINGWSKSFSLAVGDTAVVTITDATVLNAIKEGQCKGFGVKGAYDSSHYSVLSGSCTLSAIIED